MAENVPFIDTPFVKWFLAIVAIAGLGWGVYGHFHTKSPKLVYEIQSRAVIFNKTDVLSSVRLFIDSLDVVRSNQNISVYTFKVGNTGSKSLTSLDYDEGPFGINVSNGEVIKEATVGEASNTHILERYYALSPSSSRSFVEIPHIALDKKDWYSFSFAILHAYDSEPEFETIGKIIGQKEIEILSTYSGKMSFWESVFYGDLFVVSVRIVIYFLILLIISVIICVPVFLLIDFADNKKREKEVSLIATNPGIEGFIRDDFLDKEKREIIPIAWYYYSLGDEKLNELYIKAKEFVCAFNNINDSSFEGYRQIYLDINRLISSRYLLFDNQVLTIPRTIEESVKLVNNSLPKIDYYPWSVPRKRLEAINDLINKK